MDIVEALHVVGAVFLVGPVAMAGMYAPRSVRSGDVGILNLLARITLTFGIGTVVVGLLGFGLVSGDGPGFGATWILLSVVLWAIAVALSLGVLLPALTEAARRAGTGADSASLKGRIMAGGMVPTTLYLLVAVLMVTKPDW